MSKKLDIEIASKALDPEVMWRNHFEDKLTEGNKKLDDRLKVIAESFKKKEEEIDISTKEQISGLQEQLIMAREELLEATQELKMAREERERFDRNKEGREVEDSGNLQVHRLEQELSIGRPKSSRNFIPETTYIKGVLLGGISVSTGVNSPHEPTPVIVRIIGSGNLAKNFDLDIKTCRILGSSYGDLSSERAIIRAEVMSCVDEKTEQVVTTKIAGVIFGNDGLGGVKGKVVQTSNKQLKNVVLGGLLSGFSNTAKSTDQFALTSMGAISTKQPPFGERLKDNSLAGLGNAGEKIADYYLRQAESMSPVLQIPAGSKVDVVFTKGVYLGSLDVKEHLNKDRRSSSQGDER
jgi:hypothetical protein